MLDIKIINGLVVLNNGVNRVDIGIKGEKIFVIEKEISEKAKRVLNADGKIVIPGCFDVHTHPVYLDDLYDLSVSAAYGGVTTVIHYAYAYPESKLIDVLKKFKDEGQQKSILDFGLHGGIFDAQNQISEVPEAINLGVTSFKFFMAYAKLGWMTNDYYLIKAFDVISANKGMAIVHAESGLAIDYLEDKFRFGNRDPRKEFEQTRPGLLEAEAVNRALAFSKITNCPLYIPHISAKETVSVVAKAKNEGFHIYAETCPQYLLLTWEETEKQGARAKIGPPLRRDDDRMALWNALQSGVIDVVASDHAPKAKEVEDEFWEAPYGAPQTETMLPLLYHYGVNQGFITLRRLVEVMCELPAKIFGLYPKKGTIAIGSDADLVILDPSMLWTISSSNQHSKANYTLYEGWQCLGKPIIVMQRGEILIEKDELLSKPGRARFLPTQAGQYWPFYRGTNV
jgi:dihydropyrimidinase